MTEIYTSGVGTLKELANTLNMKASSDMEQIQSKVSSQTLAVQNVRSLFMQVLSQALAVQRTRNLKK